MAYFTMRFQDRRQLQNKADAIALAVVTGGKNVAHQLAVTTAVRIDSVVENSAHIVVVHISNSAGSATASAAP